VTRWKRRTFFSYHPVYHRRSSLRILCRTDVRGLRTVSELYCQ